jgi:GT2 family glycosyltransferase
MNPVLILTHNNLDLTKKCVDSVFRQDNDAKPFIYDNGSTDGTREWLHEQRLWFHESEDNRGVSVGWNWSLKYLFSGTCLARCENILVLNNDLILSPTFYSQLLSCNVPFVTGTETTDLADLKKEWPSLPFGGGPQFSAFMIRRDAWEKIGPFDESMWGWCSDCDYHIRAHRLGIRLLCSPVRYYHERSSTIETAPLKEKRQLQMQADADRLTFAQKYGFRVFDPQYTAMFDEKNFGIDAK